MSTERTVTANAGEQSISFSREFEAPATLVFEAHTDAALIAQWTGPRGTQLAMRQFDARTGGSWSYVISGGGEEWGFHGSFHEVTSPSRIVQTFEFEGEPGHPTLEVLSSTSSSRRTPWPEWPKPVNRRRDRGGYVASVAAVLVTGISGTGKSAALIELRRRGHRVVDTDEGDWIEDAPLPDGSGSEPMWREDRIDALLAEPAEGALFVSGCVWNQGKFYPRFDAVVLLSAPLDVILERVASRQTNNYGKTEAERQQIVRDVATVEPLLRAGATTEIDTRKTLDEVADQLEFIANTAR